MSDQTSAWWSRKKKVVEEEPDDESTRDMLIDFIHDNDERMADLGALSVIYGKKFPEIERDLERLLESIRKINQFVGPYRDPHETDRLTLAKRMERLERMVGLR
jgi:hypothetical protein